jgi:hypothetical protein
LVISHDYPALLRARRRRDRWSAEDQRLYQRHRWRSEGFHGEAKTWHGLARAVRRGLQNMKIQAYLTAAAINLKRLAAALFALLRLLPLHDLLGIEIDGIGFHGAQPPLPTFQTAAILPSPFTLSRAFDADLPSADFHSRWARLSHVKEVLPRDCLV